MLSNFVLAAAFTLFFLVLGWRWGTRSGIPPGSLKKHLPMYGIMLVLGGVYLIYWFADLKWPRLLLLAAIVSWGVLLGGGIWYRAQARRGNIEIAGK